MKNVYLIQLYTRVRGTEEPFQKGEILYGFKNFNEAFEECGKLAARDKENPDNYLEFQYGLIETDIY